MQGLEGARLALVYWWYHDQDTCAALEIRPMMRAPAILGAVLHTGYRPSLWFLIFVIIILCIDGPSFYILP